MNPLMYVVRCTSAALVLVAICSGCFSGGGRPSFGVKPIGVLGNGDVVLAAGRSSGPANLFQFTPEQSQWRKTYASPLPVSGWHLSPDETTILLGQRDRGHGVLGKLALRDGSFTELFRTDNIITEPVHSPDGRIALFVVHDTKRSSTIMEIDLGTNEVRPVSVPGAMYASPFYFGGTPNIGGVRLSEWGHYSPIASSTWQKFELIALRGAAEPAVMKMNRSRVDDSPLVFMDGARTALLRGGYIEYSAYFIQEDQTVQSVSVPLDRLYVPAAALSLATNTAIALTWSGSGEDKLVEYRLDDSRRYTTLYTFEEPLGVRDAGIVASADGNRIGATLLVNEIGGDVRPLLVVHDRTTGQTRTVDVPTEFVPQR